MTTYLALAPDGTTMLASADLLACMDAIRGQEIGSRVVTDTGVVLAVRAASGLYAQARGTASHLHRKNRRQRGGR